jgi:hypothetical protein
MLNKILLSFYFILFSCNFSYCQITDSVKKKRIYYSYEEKAYYENINLKDSNKLTFPMPSLSEKAFRKKLKYSCYFPTLAKKIQT